MRSPYSSPLGRRIILAVVAATMSSVLVTIVGLYLAYGVIERMAPGLVVPVDGGWLPNGVEWLVIGTLAIIAMSIAAFSANALARHIITPVVSVAENARRIADGDLAARAELRADTLSELSILVDDFNLLAARLERASEAVTQWNATIAHELRTPVTILRGRLQGLADGVFAPEPQLFRSLEAHATGLSRLIDDLRTVTLFDCGQLLADIQPTDLAANVWAAIEFVRPELEKFGFSIEAAVEPVTCDADGARIKQAMIALLENARRHANPGKIQVALFRRDHLVHLSIRDEGPGLPPEFEKDAFDAFRRHVVEGDAPKSSGLGLSVVRAIAEVHAGVASYSKVGGGACFTITIPSAAPR